MDTSYLAKQVNSSIGQLHGLFDEIGVPNHEREARESEVSFICVKLCPLRTWLTWRVAFRSTLAGTQQPSTARQRGEEGVGRRGQEDHHYNTTDGSVA